MFITTLVDIVSWETKEKLFYEIVILSRQVIMDYNNMYKIELNIKLSKLKLFVNFALRIKRVVQFAGLLVLCNVLAFLSRVH